MPDLKILAGLGNPGPKHRGQRHNAGYWVVDALLESLGATLASNRRLYGESVRIELGGQDVLLLKPDTYMNRSGQSVQAACAYYKVSPDALLVAHDDLDLPAGTLRLKRGGGHGGHNGLRDISARLGPDFRRLRVGIDHPGHKDDVLGYVLGRPGAAEERQIRDAIDDSLDALGVVFSDWDRAVRTLHSNKTRESDQ